MLENSRRVISPQILLPSSSIPGTNILAVSVTHFEQVEKSIVKEIIGQTKPGKSLKVFNTYFD